MRLLEPSIAAVFILNLVGSQANAQKQTRQRIDSLLSVLKQRQKNDSGSVNILNALSAAWEPNAPDTALYFAKQAMTIAEKIKFTKGIAEAWDNLGYIYEDKGDNSAALNAFSSELKMYEDVGYKRGIASAHNNIGAIYEIYGNYADALKNHKMALITAQETGDKRVTAVSYEYVGRIYDDEGNYPEALKNYFASLKISEEIGFKNGICDSYNDIGIIYKDQGNYPEALKAHFASLKITEETGDNRRAAIAYSNIGNIYEDEGDYTDALKEFFAALKICQEAGNEKSIGDLYNNVADIYLEQANYKEALMYYTYSLKIKQQIGDRKGIAMAHSNIGIACQSQENYPEALRNYLAALRINIETGDRESTGSTYINMGSLFIRLKKYGEAGKYLDSGMAIAKEVGNATDIRDAYGKMQALDSATGNWKNAYLDNKQYTIFKDSILNRENTKKLVQNQMQYEFDKREDSLRSANEKKLAVADEKSRAKLTVSGIAGAAILLASFTGFYFYRRRENDGFKLKITEIKQEALNAQMSDHFIGNAMDSIKGFIENNEKEKASEYLVLFNRLIRKVLENSFKKQVLLNEELEVLNMYVALEKLRFPEGALQYEIIVDKEIDGDNTFIPPMILQVLSENAIKHGFNKAFGGTLKIKAEKKGTAIACTVEDNGIGRHTATQSRSDADKKRISFGGSLAEKLINASSGADWKSFYKITDLSDGNGEATGTRVEFTLPFIFGVQS